jgi:carboxymethylenebutenolidase
MCFDDDARPPIPVRADTGASGRDITLAASDGAGVMAYRAEPGDTAESQVIILPDVRGLHQFYKELAMRFAESGKRALAIDYFARTTPDSTRTDSFEYMPHVQAMTPETFGRDLRAAASELRQSDGADLPTYTVGFCYGGSLSFWAGTQHLNLAGVIGFYAGFRTTGARRSPLEFAAEIESPVLGLFGGADESIPKETIDEFEAKLNAAGIPNEIVVYPGAPHSFFDRRATDFAQESADAWMRIQGFMAGREPVTV